ncbi:MAG TPA: ARMT1-like domain-containing protein [Nitrospirota bacterium]|nr:ARMT1-like domain-containing protein [Nitrospirota bacterium]
MAMKTELRCLPCFFGQVSRSLHHAGVNGDRGRAIMRMAEAIIERAALDDVPARTTTLIHRMVRGQTGSDPYAAVKREYNRVALALLPALQAMAQESNDRLEAGVRVAIAGNVIDFGIYDTVDLDRSVEDSFRLPLVPDVFRLFSDKIRASRRILYLCDNAGEIVFDRVLLDILRAMGKDTLAVVKGAPVINDATLDDARDAGLVQSSAIMDNGSDGIGTLLETCSPAFLDAYRNADVIISKGQANYETLAGECDERTFFLFKVKCPVVAEHLGRPTGDIVLLSRATAQG